MAHLLSSWSETAELSPWMHVADVAELD